MRAASVSQIAASLYHIKQDVSALHPVDFG